MILETALKYAARGWAVIPLHTAGPGGCSCGNQKCESVAKHPRTPNGVKDATTDQQKIREWWGRWPDANIGVATGAVSGLVVLDIDGDVGRATAKGLLLPVTPLVETGRGLHAYFSHPGHRVQNQQDGGWFKLKYPGLDLRGDGGYVVAPPSVHATGRTYSWHDELDPEKKEPAKFPAWMENGGAEKPKGPAPPLPEKIPKGERYIRLVSLAGSMRRRGADQSEILAALEAVNSRRCDPPYDAAKLRGIAEDIERRYEPAEQVQQHIDGPPMATDSDGVRELGPDGGALTDLGNAERLVAIAGGALRHVAAWGSWLVWTGTRWTKDETGEVVRVFAGCIKALYARAGDIADSQEKKKWVGHLHTSESGPRIAAALKIAESLSPVAVQHNIFDSDTMRLNCLNGTVDLSVGVLRPHDPADHITKLAPVEHSSTADAPLWDSFLKEVQPDPAVRDFLQRAVGYSITGDVSEQVLFFLYGLGANGKSTFLGVLRRVLGDYAMRAAPDLLTNRAQAAHPAERADLFGARMVLLSETERGERLAEAVVKDLTGGDTIKARELYRPFFEFKPTHKIWMAANHKPDIRGADYAVWRRIIMVPWEVTIPETKRDKSIEDRLVAEAPGILRWAVEGCLEWRRSGLAPPPSVLAAVADYRSQSDLLGEWVDAECVVGPGLVGRFTDLYDSYLRWADGAHEKKPLGRKAFAFAMDERGFGLLRAGKSRERLRVGIRLSTQPNIGGEVVGRTLNITSTPMADGRTDDPDFYKLISRAHAQEIVYRKNGHTSADSDSSVRHPSAVYHGPDHGTHPSWFSATLLPFDAFSCNNEEFRGPRDPETGRWFPGDPTPKAATEAQLAALRARGAITSIPPPPEAATCPRCGSTWTWGGPARGWVWGCCGDPAPSAPAHALPSSPPAPPPAAPTPPQPATDAQTPQIAPQPTPNNAPGRCPRCGRSGYLIPGPAGYPVCTDCAGSGP